MKGTATISLEDLDKLRSAAEEKEKIKTNTVYFMKEIQVFLSFLCTRSNIELYVEEYNKQAKSSKIKLVNGRVTIEKIDDNVKIEDAGAKFQAKVREMFKPTKDLNQRREQSKNVVNLINRSVAGLGSIGG